MGRTVLLNAVVLMVSAGVKHDLRANGLASTACGGRCTTLSRLHGCPRLLTRGEPRQLASACTGMRGKQARLP
jgi:hypothetical protein